MSCDPLSAHRSQVGDTLASGDPAAIKRLYITLGDDLRDAHAADPSAVPVLSAPETGPAVVGRLRAVSGAVLDAGCGPNPAVSIGLASVGGRTVVALDIGWGMVDLARRVAAGRGVAVVPIVGDVEALPFRDGVFDGIVCDDCIEHLPDDAAGVGELARVARPGAPIVMATPNRHSALVIRARLRDRIAGRHRPAADYFVANSHLREYTWREFEALVRPVAAITAREPIAWDDGGWKRRLLSGLVRHRPFHRLSQMIVVQAERT